MLPIKVQQQKTVKPSGQCLTLVSVCLHLLVLVLPPPPPSQLLGPILTCRHSFGCTNRPTGHELSYLWDMSRTWLRAQITEKKKRDPDSRGLQPSFLAPSPSAQVLVGLGLFPALCAAVESSDLLC